jgi:hypothetical protein
MKFLRGKGITIVISIVTVLCLATVAITVDVTINMYRRYNKLVRIPEKLQSTNLQRQKNISRNGDVVNVSTDKIKELSVYYNGQKVHDVIAIATVKKEVFISLDSVLLNLGIKFNYFNSDDILECEIDGKKLVVRLGDAFFQYGGERINLSAPSLAAKDHILVSADLFDYINGFKVDGYSSRNIVFINHYNNFNNTEMNEVKFFRSTNGIEGITDISGRKNFWPRDIKNVKDEDIDFSPDMSTGIVKSGSKVYLIETKTDRVPYLINVSPTCTFSEDSRYLYWVDQAKKTSYIYDIARHKTEELGDYYFRLNSNPASGNSSPYGELLNYYNTGNSFRVISLTSASRNGNYTFIERNGRVFYEGNVLFSPDKKRIIYYKNGIGYFTARVDGMGETFLGGASKVVWVNNDRIFLQNTKGKFVFNRYGNNKIKANSEWEMLGNAENGDIFYTDGSTLYSRGKGIGSKEKRIFRMPWKCSYIYAHTGKGPYIIATNDNTDDIFYLSVNKLVKLGKVSLLFKDANERDVFVNYKSSVIMSPDGRKIITLQRQWGFVTVSLVDTKTSIQKELVLNYDASNQAFYEPVNTIWLPDERLLVYTELKGWIIDFKNEGQIYQWNEMKGSTIKAVLTKRK